MAHLLRALAAGTAAFAAMLGTGLGPVQATPVVAEMPFEAAAAAPAALLAPETPVVEPGADLPVTLMVRNTTDEAQPATEVTVAVSASSIDTRFALEAWLAGEQVLYALPVASTTVPALAPGVSYTTTLRIRGADLPWGSGEDAPPSAAYGLRLIGHQAEASSAVTVGSKPDGPPIGLALAAELTAPQAGAGLLTPEELQRFMGPQGTLTRQLDAVEHLPISVGIDPLITSSLDAAGSDTRMLANEWRLRTGVLPHRYRLPYAGSDVVTQVQAGLTPLEPVGIPTATGVLAYRPQSEPEPAVIDARGRALTAETLHTVATHGVPLVLGDGGELGAFPTPDAAATAHDTRVVVADAPLNSAFEQAQWGATPAERAAGRAAVFAELSTISREAPYAERILASLVALRSPGAVPLLEALANSKWVSLAPMSALDALAPREVGLTGAEPSEAEQRAIELATTVHGVDTAVASFAEVAESPARILAPVRLQALAALGSATAGTEQFSSATQSLRLAADDMLGHVYVQRGSTINAVGSAVALPIGVVNELPVPVTVTLHVRTTNANVVVQEPEVTLTLPPGSVQRVAVPVEVVGSGVTTARVYLSAGEGGTWQSDPIGIRVEAQPQLERVVLWLGVAAVALLVGVGVWRSVRKRRQGLAAGDIDVALAAQEAGDAER